MRSLYCDWGWKGGIQSWYVGRLITIIPTLLSRLIVIVPTASSNRHRPYYLFWSSSSQLTTSSVRHRPHHLVWSSSYLSHHLIVIVPITSSDRHRTDHIIWSSSYLSHLIVIVPITSHRHRTYHISSSTYLLHHLIVIVLITSSDHHRIYYIVWSSMSLLLHFIVTRHLIVNVTIYTSLIQHVSVIRPLIIAVTELLISSSVSFPHGQRRNK